MENLVVSLETAKKLKAAGFPQKGAPYWWSQGLVPVFMELSHRYASPYDTVPDDMFAAPTAQEIADQLPSWEDMGKYPCLLNVQPNPVGKGWQAMYRHDSTSPKAHHCGAINLVTADTMAEALANLWLKLKEAD